MTDAPDALSWSTAAIRALPAYRQPQTFHDFENPGTRPRLLHLNENPYPPSPMAMAAAIEAMHDVNRYPDIGGRKLAEAVGKHFGGDPSLVILGCGSDELIHFTTVIALETGDEAVVPAPSFPRYALSAKLAAAKPVRARIDKNGACDVDATLRSIGNRTKLVVACTPNPPSGGMMTEEALKALIDGVPENVLLLLDEAYAEFGRHAGGPDALKLLRKRKGPWISTRTFSKAYGLAAMRVGYAICGDASVAEALRRCRLQYNVPTPSQAAAVAALADQAHLKASLDKIAVERKRLTEGLVALGLKTWPSTGNFVSITLNGPSAPMMAALAKEGILVRDWRDPDYMNELRIGVGTAEDTDAVLAALARLLNGGA
ncbi:MAG: aminotransferase class I/II-fold pyridoxal phosphate-dependent enzyme [Alphaproteobacteria bacterium]|nr:aminotransferase class I/II-fold pyridoxal phosphate-dependent enzyme [Alphaproteobacteria bacterium]